MSQHERDFESAVHAVYAPLVRSASVLCWSGSDVEDVVQETILRALRSYGVVQRVVVLPELVLRDPRTGGVGGKPAPVAADPRGLRRRPKQRPAAGGQSSPGGRRARVLVDAIRSLPQRQREMITLHFLQELSYADIAQAHWRRGRNGESHHLLSQELPCASALSHRDRGIEASMTCPNAGKPRRPSPTASWM